MPLPAAGCSRICLGGCCCLWCAFGPLTLEGVGLLVEIIVVVLALGFLATPVVVWVALARTSELRRSIASLELDVRNIRLRLAAMQRASAPPSPVDEDVESALETGGEHGDRSRGARDPVPTARSTRASPVRGSDPGGAAGRRGPSGQWSGA